MADLGMVTLVGAGPGDPGLLTLAGREALAAAGVVLYDRLAGEETLRFANPEAELVDVGKNKGNHPTPQSEINRLLVSHARQGKRVVRLKGGDPFLFGRGAEELDALREHGIPFRVVPGVTSALAAPAYLGIPVTHRDYASSVHIFTGHGRDGRAPDIPYDLLAKLDGTLVFLMATSALGEIAAGLLGAGLDGGTPAAVVQRGTAPDQRLVAANLADIVSVSARAGIAPPAIFLVGKTAALSEHYDWTRYLPLWGKRALVASSHTTVGRLAAKLRELGCRVDEFAAIRREPLALPDGFRDILARYAWIVFTSAHGVDLFFRQLTESGNDVRSLSRVKFAAVGEQTAAALRERGIVADYVPAEQNGHGLGVGLAAIVKPSETLLLFRNPDGNPDLPAVLAENGVAFDEVAAYRTSPAGVLPKSIREKIAGGEYDAATFTSASAVRSLSGWLADADLGILPCVCIGDSTAAAARRAGWRVETAAVPSLDAMVDRIVSLLGELP